MKKLLSVLFIVSALVWAGCNAGGGDPKTVLAEFFDALSNKDFDKAKKLSTSSSSGVLDMVKMGMQMDQGTKENDKFDKSKMEFGDVKIDGDMATVAVKETGSGSMMNYKLKKEDGKWKVAFDKESLVGMGMETMKSNGVDPQEQIDDAKKQMENIDMDSLRKAMQESMPQ